MCNSKIILKFAHSSCIYLVSFHANSKAMEYPLLEMSVTYHQHVAKTLSCWKISKKCVQVQRASFGESANVAYQRMTQDRKIRHVYFLVIFLLFVVRQTHCTNKKKYACLVILIFSRSLALFRDVTVTSVACQKIYVLLVLNPTQNKTTFPTKWKLTSVNSTCISLDSHQGSSKMK